VLHAQEMQDTCQLSKRCGKPPTGEEPRFASGKGALPVSGGAFSDWIALLMAVSRVRGRILAAPAADGQEKCAGDGEGKAGAAGAAPLEALNKAIPGFSALQPLLIHCNRDGV